MHFSSLVKGVAMIGAVVLLGAGCGSTEVVNTETNYNSNNNQATAPAPEPIPVVQPETVKIGFIGPMTGDVATIGNLARTAVQVATDEINEAGGINGKKVEVIFEDGKCNAGAATQAANKLINIDKVVAINGGLCSSETAAFAPAAMQNKIPVISFCSSAPNLTGTGEYFFRSYPSDAYQGKSDAEYAFNVLKVKKVSILYHVSDWGTGLKDKFEARFKELGGEVLNVEGAPQDSKDYRTSLTKIKASKPEMIFAPLYTEGGIVAIKQARELGLKMKIFGADAFADPKLQSSATGDVIYSEPVTATNNEAFNQKVLARAGATEMTICAPQAYDNMKILAQAMSQVGTNDPGKIADTIRAMKYDGVSGSISFDQNGDLAVADYVIKKIEGGKAVEVK